MTAAELFRDGRLADAIAAQVEAVKAGPADLGRRTFLFELYGFAGDLERADRQLAVLEQQKIELGLAVGAYRQCLEAELARREVFAGERDPAYLGEPPEIVRRHAAALRLLGEDRLDEARAELAAVERPQTAGEAAGSPFADFRDADDLLAPVFEFYHGPNYTWVPISSVRTLTLSVPAKPRPRDLLWSICSLELVDGTTREGVMPVLYPNTHEADDDVVRLGRSTDWLGYEGGPTFGQGMRTFLVDGEERGMLEAREVVFRSEP